MMNSHKNKNYTLTLVMWLAQDDGQKHRDVDHTILCIYFFIEGNIKQRESGIYIEIHSHGCSQEQTSNETANV